MKISDMHNYITRQATDDRLFIPKFKTECLKHSPFVAGVTVWNNLKMDYNENPHIKLTIDPCLCCVQVTIYCCGHVFLFIILLQFDRKNKTPLLRFLKFSALHWFPTKTH